MKTILNFFALFLIFCMVLFFNLLAHEFGHCLTMNAVGGGCSGVYILPGIQVWPPGEFGQAYLAPWPGYIGMAVYSDMPPSMWHSGLVSLLGSGSTALLSMLALVALWMFHLPKWARWPLFFQSWMFLDLLTYTILPEWFGLQHFFFIGGYTPEPLDGAAQMGLAQEIFIALVLVFSALMTAGALAALYQRLIVGRFRQPSG